MSWSFSGGRPLLQKTHVKGTCPPVPDGCQELYPSGRDQPPEAEQTPKHTHKVTPRIEPPRCVHRDPPDLMP